MTNVMRFKSYVARVEYDGEADLFHGEVINLRDVITFQGKSVRELRKAFRDSVADYLAFCKERGEDPEKPFSGKVLVRLPHELHRDLSHAAAAKGKSLNAWIVERLARKNGRRQGS
jgi:predicted HicB family RNase H-like nuclease